MSKKVINFIGMLAAAFILFSCGMAVQSETEETSATSNAQVEKAFPGLTGEVKTGYIDVRGKSVEVKYEQVGNYKVVEGDMVFPAGSISDTPITAPAPDGETTISRSCGSKANLWKNNTLYYQIHPNVFQYESIVAAINELNRKTNLKFVNSTGNGNYVHIVPDYQGGCWSYVGMIGGRQELHLANWATKGVAMHELLHAAGFWHEQSRASRDNWVTIHWNNIDSNNSHNFNKADGPYDVEIGGNKFDFDSIMLYSSWAFSVNGRATMTKKDGSTFHSNRDYLSADDIRGVNEFYPDDTVIEPPQPTVKYYKIISRASGHALDTHPGYDYVLHYPDNGDTDKEWLLTIVDNRYYKIIKKPLQYFNI